MYTYFLYGLGFSSDIRLFNIPETEASTIDVSIHKGTISYDGVLESQRNFFYDQHFAVLTCTFGELRINDGREIIYSLKEGASSESISPFIVGWGIAFLLTQRGHSVFHCSALSRNDKCFLVSGASGAGKSTTALNLIKKGCLYLTDDLAIVNSFEDMMVPPAYPIQKVCRDVSLTLENDKLYSIHNDRGKYSYLNTDDFCDKPQKLQVIFKLLLSDSDKVTTTEVTGIMKYMKTIESLFFAETYSHFGLPDDDKYRCLKIAGNIRVFTITRPRGMNTLDEITDTIIRIMDSLED